MCALVQAEYDAMLQEFAGEGIPLLASSVPADSFAPFLNDLLPLIMSKTVSLNLMTNAGSTFYIEPFIETCSPTGYTDKNTFLQSLWYKPLIFSHI